MTDAHEAAREWFAEAPRCRCYVCSSPERLAALLTSRESAAVATAMAELQVRVRRTGLLENEKITRKKLAEIIERIAPTLRDRPTFSDTWRAVEAAARAGAVEEAARMVESMVIGGRAWTDEQRIAAEALLAAAQNVRSLAALPPDRVVVAVGDLRHALEGLALAGMGEGPALDRLRAALARLEASQ